MRIILWICLLVFTGAGFAAPCGAPLGDKTLPLDYAEAVLKGGALHVRIKKRQISRVANVLDRAGFAMRAPTWSFPPYPAADASFDQMFVYFLSLNAINYMYRDADTGRTYDDGGLIGAGLAAERLTAYLEELSDPGFLYNMTVHKAARIFKAENPLPEMQRRATHLQAVGNFLAAHHGADWKKWLRKFRRGVDLAQHLADHVPGFNDGFLKRAQLFVGMLNGRFGKTLPKGVRNLDGMTVYADYILPMILFRMGILEYSEPLLAKIQHGEAIYANSREELEIRASTLVAANELLNTLRTKERYKNLTVLDLDSALWLQGKEIVVPGADMPKAVFKHGEMPHHQTMTTNY